MFSLQNLKNSRQDEVEGLQKQVDLLTLKTAHLGLEKNRAHAHSKQLVDRCGRAEVKLFFYRFSNERKFERR